MLHGVMRQGGYDANIASLASGASTYSDGTASVRLAPGKYLVESDEQVREIDDESMYGNRPGEDKDRGKTDST